MGDQCVICLDSASSSPHLSCTAKQHIVHNYCVNGYLRESILPQIYKLRSHKCKIKCVVPSCAASMSILSVFESASNKERLRLASIVKDIMLEDSEVAQIRNMIFEALTLKCPSCFNTVDPYPDACSAVMCLSCGHYYCNYCFMSFSHLSSTDEERSLAHEHSAGHHPSSSPTERSSFLPEDTIKQGQKIYQRQQVFDSISSHLINKQSVLNDSANSMCIYDYHVEELTLLLLSDELQELSIQPFGFWEEILSKLRVHEQSNESEENIKSIHRNVVSSTPAEATSTTVHIYENNLVNDIQITTTTTQMDHPAVPPIPSIISESPPGTPPANARQGGIQLANAIKTQNMFAINQLFNAFPDTLDVNYVDTEQSGEPVTSLAVLAKFNEVAIKLIEMGADPFIRNTNNSTAGRTVLFIVLEAEATDVFETILRHHPQINLDQPLTTESFSYFPIHVVTKYGHYSLLKRLIELRVDLEVKEGEYGYSPLSLALVMGFEWCAILLMQSGANIRAVANNGRSALCLCAEKGLTVSLEHMASVHSVNLDEMVYPRCNYRLLHIAAFHNQPSIISFLLNKGANPNFVENEGGYTPLFMAMLGNNITGALILIHGGADIHLPSSTGRLPIYLACERGQETVVRALIDKGVQVNRPTTNEFAKSKPLHVAVLYGQNHLISTLVALGADVNVTEEEGGWTPLMMALLISNETAAILLLKNGADPSKRCRQQRTAIFVAVERELCSIITLLVQTTRVSPNAICCGDGAVDRRPLHVAALYNKPMAAWTLLRLGADINMRGSRGITALELARQHEAADVVSVLEGYSTPSL